MSKLQSDVEYIYSIVNSIREHAINGDYSVVRKGYESNWKNRLFSLISDEVIINHLKYLHPFQYKGKGNVLNSHIFVTRFWNFNVYLKLNIRDNLVMSFWYDEIPEILPHINQEFYKCIEKDRVMVIADDSSGGQRIVRFAVGSTMASYNKNTQVYVDGSVYLEPNEVLSVFTDRRDKTANKLYQKLRLYDRDITKVIDLWVERYNFFTFSDEDIELKFIFTCYDMWLKDKEQLWLKDMAIDLLLSFPEHLQQQFVSQISRGDYACLDLPTKEF